MASILNGTLGCAPDHADHAQVFWDLQALQGHGAGLVACHQGGLQADFRIAGASCAGQSAVAPGYFKSASLHGGFI